MKPNRFERSYRDTIPLRGVWVTKRTNYTPLSRSRGRLGFVCPICFIAFERPAAWAKRDDNHYCSRACYAEARRVRVEQHCAVCGAAFSIIPSYVGKVVTCGRTCRQIKRRCRGRLPTRAAGLAEGARLIAQLKAATSSCPRCGSTSGPWIVRGLVLREDADGYARVDASAARVECRRCYDDEHARANLAKMWAARGIT